MAEPLSIVIFGASGDLTGRKLVPALYHLDSRGRLPDGTRVVGVARSPFTDETFRAQMEDKTREAVHAAGASWHADAWRRFAGRLHYVPADATKAEGMREVAEGLRRVEGGTPGSRLYYLPVAAELYPGITTLPGETGLNREDGGFRRLVIEKQFGHDRRSARGVNGV